MEQSLSYVLVTPYTVAKSRTGGVLSRLLSRISLELVGAQMIAMDLKIAQDYASIIRNREKAESFIASVILGDYVEQNLAPSGGVRHQFPLAVFRGEIPSPACAGMRGLPARRQLQLDCHRPVHTRHLCRPHIHRLVQHRCHLL